MAYKNNGKSSSTLEDIAKIAVGTAVGVVAADVVEDVAESVIGSIFGDDDDK